MPDYLALLRKPWKDVRCALVRCPICLVVSADPVCLQLPEVLLVLLLAAVSSELDVAVAQGCPGAPQILLLMLTVAANCRS